MLNEELQRVMNPPDQQDEFTIRMRSDEMTFRGAKRLEDGTYVGILRLAFTWAICIGTDAWTPAKRRYCFEQLSDCLSEYAKITTGEDVPEGWIARRPKPDSDDWYRP